MHLAALLARARPPCVHIRTPDQLSLELRSRVGSERAARPRWLGHAHALLREGRVLRSGRSRSVREACRAAGDGLAGASARTPPPAAEKMRGERRLAAGSSPRCSRNRSSASRAARRVQPARAAVGALEPRAAPPRRPRAARRSAKRSSSARDGHGSRPRRSRTAAPGGRPRVAARRSAAAAPRPRSCVSSSVSRAASRRARGGRKARGNAPATTSRRAVSTRSGSIHGRYDRPRCAV